VGRWSQDDIERLLRDVRELVKFLQRAHEGREAGGGRSARDRLILSIYDRRFTLDELERTYYGGASLTANGLLRRGAVLHADIARFIAGRLAGEPLVNDGGRKGWRPGTPHWEIGRELLDGVTPDPASDAGVVLWYRAVSAHLLNEGRLSEATEHLDKARQLFRQHPAFLIDSGYLHQEFSSPSIQAAIHDLRSDGVEVRVGSKAAELQRAEQFLRQALTIQPEAADARLRLGHTLGELGRHQDAVNQLTRINEDEETPAALLYLKELILGKQEQALGHHGEARRRYERAAALFPGAQAPRIALSQLARQAGDRPAALRALERIETSLPPAGGGIDPWWDYYQPHGADAEALVAKAWEMMTGLTILPESSAVSESP
jgi:predicted Zn-dependent protease